MASTNFIDKTTVVPTAWLNEVNGTVWTLFGAASTASAGRTALGLGTMATQNANSVAITGGSFSGGTITGLTSPLPVASGGTGVTSSTGTSSVVLSNSPTLDSVTVNTALLVNRSGSGEFGIFTSSAAGTEPALRLVASDSTSGIGLKLANSGLNKQATLRANSDGGFSFYVNQTAGGSSTSGTQAILVNSAGGATFTNALGSNLQVTENGTRVFSRNSAFVSPERSVAANTDVQEAHGLAGTPALVRVVLICKIAEYGYVVGEEVEMNFNFVSGGGQVGVSADSTNVYIEVGNNINLLNKLSKPNVATIAYEKWRWVIRAWY